MKNEVEESQNPNMEHLKKFLYLNELRLFHNYRNDSHHVGGIQKEGHLLEIFPVVLQAMRAFLEVFFQEQVDELERYLSAIFVVKDPLELEKEQAYVTWVKGQKKLSLLQKFEVVKKAVSFISKQVLDSEAISSNKIFLDIIEELILHPIFIQPYNSRDLETIPKDFKEIINIRDFIIGEINFDEAFLTKAHMKINTILAIVMNTYRVLKREKEEKNTTSN
ncbi:MAG: hypothetical protein GF308_22250 [Candidatus Heimdallarchaeota archaeon]|nr:hypothetical protein [Candidatus Heimdallarchaeota archaeon]